MRISENKGAKTGCHGHVRAGDHVIQVSNYSQKILRKVAKFGVDCFHHYEVIHLQSLRGPRQPTPVCIGLNVFFLL